jgi:hypothetical protein
MTTRPLAAALLALSALGFAACGEDTPSAAGGADSKEEVRQAELKFASCMREQGIDMPDPVFDDEGGFSVRAEAGERVGSSPRDDEDFQAAAEECGGPGGAMIISSNTMADD